MNVALFDLENDPWETSNPADDSAYANLREDLGDFLQAGWKSALPGQ